MTALTRRTALAVAALPSLVPRKVLAAEPDVIVVGQG